MKKIASLFIAFLMLMSLSLCAFATDLGDGTYEVPVVLMHKEDEKESFGNKYVAQTALLEVENGNKTITILLTTDMKGIEFSYYTDGSLSGDVAKGTTVSNITVAGKTYKQGFEIPVMADGDIGLQFSVPVMPMSPSARLRIDYSKAVKISTTDTTIAPETEAVVTTTEPVTQVPETTTETHITTETTVAPITSTESTTALQPNVSYEETTYTYTTESIQESEANKTISSIVMLIFGTGIATVLLPFLILIVLIVIIITVVKKKKMKRVKNNDDK